MRKEISGQTLMMLSCLICGVISWRFSDYLGPSEFSGGTVTGPLFRIHDWSVILFPLAAVTTFIHLRTGAIIALVATVAAAPMYLFLLAPGVFGRALGIPSSIPSVRMFTIEPWSMAGAVVTFTTACVSAMNIRRF